MRRAGVGASWVVLLSAALLQGFAQAADQAPDQPPQIIIAAALPGSPEEAQLFAQGRAQYARTCAQCHGFNMVNYGTTAYDLRKFPLDQETRFQSSVHLGKNNMPAFGTSLSDAQINLLWVYVRNRGKAPDQAAP